MNQTNADEPSPEKSVVDHRRVMVGDHAYVVLPMRPTNSWTVTYHVVVARGREKRGGGLLGDGISYDFSWNLVLGSENPSQIDRERVAQECLRAIQLAYPEVFAHGVVMRGATGAVNGTVNDTRCPVVVAEAARAIGVKVCDDVAVMAARFDEAAKEDNPEHSGDAIRAAFAGVLAAACRANDVPAQERWARWITDPQGAARADAKAIEAAASERKTSRGR